MFVVFLITSFGSASFYYYKDFSERARIDKFRREVIKDQMAVIAAKDVADHTPKTLTQNDIADAFSKFDPEKDIVIRVQIHDGVVYADITTRTQRKTAGVIVKTLKKLAPQINGSVDFILSGGDGFRNSGDVPVFGMARNNDVGSNVILLPDHQMLKYFSGLKNNIEKASNYLKWEEKLPIAFWRGATTGDQSCYKKVLFSDAPIENMESENAGCYRLKLVRLAQLYPNLVQADFGNYIADSEAAERMKLWASIKKGIPEVDHLIFKYLPVLDGNSCTFLRFTWIMASNSVAFKQDSSDVQWYYPLLVPNFHYVPIRKDLSDLVEKINYARSHDDEMKRISMNANVFVNDYLTDQAMEDYLVLIMNEYAKRFEQKDFKVVGKKQ